MADPADASREDLFAVQARKTKSNHWSYIIIYHLTFFIWSSALRRHSVVAPHFQMDHSQGRPSAMASDQMTK